MTAGASAPGSAGGSPAQDEREAKTVELIATVSHEIRSPLTTIKGFTKTLIDRWDRLSDDTKREMLLAINADADRVTRLLTELLDVSRLEAGRLTLHRRPVDLRELAGETVDDLAERSARHVVRLVPGDPVGVQGDPDKLRQVVTNFIENALKYTDEGTVTVTCSMQGEWGKVAVADEGPGIPTARQAVLFEKFSRHDVPGAPSGTGLGLYICKGLIEAHGGRIGVSSGDGSGSTFWFEVPAVELP
ncbi:MAG TPA: ATP-binding protein [Actinomycetota bacterium]|nr:ATP-binding protein [Actinomycetota bacterium]